MTSPIRSAMRAACDILLIARDRGPEDHGNGQRPLRVIAAIHEIPEGIERDRVVAALAMFGADTIAGLTDILSKVIGAPDLEPDSMLWELVKRSLDED